MEKKRDMLHAASQHLQVAAQVVWGGAFGQLHVAGRLHASRHGHERWREADGDVRARALCQALHWQSAPCEQLLAG